MSTGQDPTFVLVPGICATSYTWPPVVRELARRGHRALPVELPGHGFDTVFPPGYQGRFDEDTFVSVRSPIAGLTLDDYAEHTLGLVRGAAGNGPVILVGPSLGGATVTRMANSAPGLVTRTVYLCAYYLPTHKLGSAQDQDSYAALPWFAFHGHAVYSPGWLLISAADYVIFAA